VIALAAARTANAAPAGESLAEAERHWRELDYELCVASADAVIAAPDAKPAERIDALRLKGSALAILPGREADAVAAFEALFEIDPDYELPAGTSPRIAKVFGPAKAGWQVKVDERLQIELGDKWTALVLDVALPERGRGGSPLPIPIRLTDPSKITDTVVVGFRRRGERQYSTISAPAGPTVTIPIPGAILASHDDYTLELFVRARHRSGASLRTRGDFDHPLAIPVAAGQVPPPALVSRWWAVGIGAAVVGGLVFVVVRSRDAGPQPIVVTR
jgi:hypothetical protein